MKTPKKHLQAMIANVIIAECVPVQHQAKAKKMVDVFLETGTVPPVPKDEDIIDDKINHAKKVIDIK